MAGFSQGGGVGLSLAQWMVHGEPEKDIFAMDVARFGDWITPEYTRQKVKENYQRRFSIGYPNEELPVARKLETTPIYDTWDAQGAVCSRFERRHLGHRTQIVDRRDRGVRNHRVFATHHAT